MESKKSIGGRKTSTTYGKSARRNLLSYTSKASNITMDDSYVNSYDFEGKADEQILKEAPSSYSIYGRRTPRTQGYTDDSNHRDSQSNISKGNPADIEYTNPQAHRSTSLYDVPSSEDETSSAYGTQSHPVSKRKRVCRGVIGQEIGIVYEKKRTPRNDSNECISEPPGATDLSEHEFLLAHPSGNDEAYSLHHNKQITHKSTSAPRSQDRQERTKNARTHRETFQNKSRLGIIKHYSSNHSRPNVQIQRRSTTPTRVTIATQPDGLLETQNISNDVNVQDPRCEISPLMVPRTPPYDAKTRYKTYTATDSIALLASRTSTATHINSDKSRALDAKTSIKTKGFAPSVLSITEGSAAALTARLSPSRARIVDKLSSTECGNLRWKHQRLGGGHTEITTTQIEASTTKGVSSSSDIEEHGFSSAEDQDLPSDRYTTLPLRAQKSVAIPNNENLKVTYARQRSYLTESDLSKDESFSIPIVVPDVSIATRNTDRISAPRVQPPYESWDVADDREDGPGNSIRSIHELREAGGTARVISDIEAILDDIDSRGGAQPSYLRNCLLDLALKLEDSANCRLLLDGGLEARLIKHTDSRSDSITNMLFMTSLLRLMRSSYTPNILTLMSDSLVLEYLGAFLGKTVNGASFDANDPSNIPKIIRAKGSKCFNSLLKSSIWTHGQPQKISTRVLALQCLEYIARHAREASGKTLELSQGTIEGLVEIAVPTRSELKFCQDIMIEIQLAVSILESTLTSADTSSHWSNSSVERMTQLLPVLKILIGENLGEPGTLALRLCLNFTNSNRVPCEAFAKIELVDAVMSIITSCFDQLSSKLPVEQQAQVSDQLVLALGLLINIAEWNENARELFLIPDTRRQISLDTLMQFFNTNFSRAPEVILPIEAI